MAQVDTASGEKTVRLFGRKVHAIRCVKGREVRENGQVVGYKRGNLFIPDVVAQRTEFHQILDVSPDCRYFGPEHIGKKVLLSPDVRGWCVEMPNDECIFDEKAYDSRNFPKMPLATFD